MFEYFLKKGEFFSLKKSHLKFRKIPQMFAITKNVSFPIGSVQFTLSYPIDEEPLPTNATLEIFYGDGTTSKHEIPSDGKNKVKKGSGNQLTFDASGSLVFNHEFARSGKYKVMFTLSNLVSSLTLKKQAFVLRRIAGLSVDDRIKGREKTAGYGPEANRYPTGQVVNFRLNVTEGDVDKYLVELNGELFKETTLDTVAFSTKEVGTHFSISPSFPFLLLFLFLFLFSSFLFSLLSIFLSLS